MDTRDRYEAQVLERRRMALALRRGTVHSTLLREPHPNRLLLGGVGIALIIVVAAAITGLVGTRAPKGWDRAGNFVLDQDSGQRYVVTGGPVLHPVLSDLSVALLYPGGAPAAVKVRHKALASVRRGDPVGRADAPYSPPQLLDATAGQQRCRRAGLTALLVGGGVPTAPVSALLVRTGQTLSLLSDGSIFPLRGALTLPRLGYRASDVVTVTRLQVGTATPGPPLAAVVVPAPNPAAPPLQREGALITNAATGASFVVSGGRLRPLPNRTAVQLVFGPRPPAPVPVPGAAIRTAPKGPTVTANGVPDVPPSVPRPTAADVVCVDGSGRARLLAALPDDGLRPAPAAAGTGALLLPPGKGLLVATTTQALTRPDDEHPVFLLADGKAFPIGSEQLVGALGYRPSDIRQWPLDLVSLAVRMPALTAIELDR